MTSASTLQMDGDDGRRLLEFVADLRSDQIRDFLRGIQEKVSGNKPQLIERISAAIDRGDATYDSLIALLDEREPWNKQHVFLYDGPKAGLAKWRSDAHVKAVLREAKLLRFYNVAIPRGLPPALELSSIRHTNDRLEVVAIRRRDVWERDDDWDDEKETDLGETVELRAYVHKVIRVLARFEWDFKSNTAMIQLSQMSRREDYVDTLEGFQELIKWLPLDAFSELDLRRAIKRFHILEEKGPKETRSHGIGYATLAGRRLDGRSATSQASLFGGEAVIDDALADVRDKGVARHGNFYFIHVLHVPNCTLHKAAEIHAVLGGDPLHVNFPTANDEVTVRYVLSRIRAASK